jgi:capsule polysaccharide export protein KpsE/RkpR
MMRPLALTVVAACLGASLVACGGSDKPAVCGSVDTLKSDVGNLKSTNLTSSGAVSSLESQLTSIKSDLDTVKSQAKSQFGPQVQAVDTAYASLQSSIDAAKSNPSAANLSALGVAAASMLTNVQTLIGDVQQTC